MIHRKPIEIVSLITLGITKIYFSSHQYVKNFFECNQFILIYLKRWFTGTKVSISGKPQYFSLNVDESERPESSFAKGVSQKPENVSKLIHSDLCSHSGLIPLKCISLKLIQKFVFKFQKSQLISENGIQRKRGNN